MSSGIGIVWLGVTVVIMPKYLGMNEWCAVNAGFFDATSLRLRWLMIKPLPDHTGWPVFPNEHLGNFAGGNLYNLPD